MHVDLQRVLDDEKIRITIPLHFKGEAASPGVKKGGVVSHLRNEIEVSCLPKDLPEFVEVDLSAVDMNQMVYLADLQLPEGVEILELTHGRNSPVVSIHHASAEDEPEATGGRSWRGRGGCGSGARPRRRLRGEACGRRPSRRRKPKKDAKK